MQTQILSRISHYIPGRIRLNFPEIKNNPVILKIIEQELHTPDINILKINKLTGRILIQYNPQQLSSEEIEKKLTIIEKKIENKTAKKNLPITEPEDISIKAQIIRLFIIGAAALFLLINRISSPKKAPMRPLVFNLNAIINIIAAYPFLNSGLKFLTGKLKINHDLLVGSTIFVLLFLQKNILGILVLWLSYLNALIYSMVMKSSEENLEDILQKLPGLDDSSYFANKPLVLKKSQYIPYSAQIIEGSAVIDESSVSGNPIPLIKSSGDHVMAGSFIKSGEIKITTSFDDKILTDLDEVVKKATVNTEVSNDINSYINKITKISFICALSSFIFTRDIKRSISVLLAANPTAASMSALGAYRFALAKAAQNNILIKDIKSLENLAETDTIIFDKTGTLTTETQFKQIIATTDKYSPEQILKLAASTEQDSMHPRGYALINTAQKLNMELLPIKKLNLQIAQGVKANIKGKTVSVGNSRFMKTQNITIPEDIELKYKSLSLRGYSVLYVSIDNQIAGLIVLEDIINPQNIRSIHNLRITGIKHIGIFTGDNRYAAQNIGKKIGADFVYGEVSPAEKENIVQKVKLKAKKVAVIGDGINDIPALRTADVSFVPGSSPQRAVINNADIILLDSNLDNINKTIQISRLSFQISRQNLALAGIFNLSGLGLALAGISSPLSSFIISNLNTLSVLLNSSRLLKISL